MQPTTPLIRYAPDYSMGERLLRTAVFQIGVTANCFERMLVWIYKAFSKLSVFQSVLDTQRAESMIQSYKNLGASIEFVTPRDGKAKIQMMKLRAADLENKLNAFGARWEKLSDNGTPILAIIPPGQPTPEWSALEHDLLKLKWKKRRVRLNEQETREVIVTCENADKIQEKDWYRHVFMHANSASVSFVMLPRRAGFYLGCKQDVCFYDPRGTWRSSGIASEAGYYNDIRAVFERLMAADYTPRQVWVTSACGGSGPSAYLKSLTHESGVNFIYENGFSDLYQDYVEPQGSFVSWFATRYRAGLASQDIDPPDKPPETGFNVYELWKNLKQTDIGKVLIINATNDQRLPQEVARRNVTLAQRVNSFVRHIQFTSTTQDPHFDRYFNYSASRAEALNSIFS